VGHRLGVTRRQQDLVAGRVTDERQHEPDRRRDAHPSGAFGANHGHANNEANASSTPAMSVISRTESRYSLE